MSSSDSSHPEEEGHGTSEDDLQQLKDELERLSARNRELELESKAVRGVGKGIFGAGAVLLAGPRFLLAARTWLHAVREWLENQQEREAPIEETAQLGAAILKRFLSVGLLGLAIGTLPIILLFQQNRLLSRQTEGFTRDSNIARRAQLISTLYDTDCSLLEDYDGRPTSDCPPAADLRSRAEAAKALYALDHPEPSWGQRIKWLVFEKPEPVVTDFTRLNLEGVELTGIDFSHADLTDAVLRDADLSEAKIRGARLFGADLEGANLINADLRGAQLDYAELSFANLGMTDLRDVDLIDANLEEAIFLMTDLRGANLKGADLSGILDLPDFPEVNHSDPWQAIGTICEMLADALAAAGFSDAELRNADFQKALLEAWLKEWDKAHLSDEKISRALIIGLSDAFSSAWLEFFPNVAFLDVFPAAEEHFLDRLKAANMVSVLDDAFDSFELDSIDVRGLFRLQIQAQLDRAYGDQETVLPDRLKFPCTWGGIECAVGDQYGEPHALEPPE